MAEPHLVLVGLPGAGKSAVGPPLASLLGRRFVDIDAEIERAAGLSISELFERDGEAGFRAREAALTAELAGDAPAVIAAGGGWMANPAALATLRSVACIIYLRVGPAEALERMGATVASRPLLAGPAPIERLEGLLARREPLYATADHALDTEGLSVEEVAESLAAMWPGLVR